MIKDNRDAIMHEVVGRVGVVCLLSTTMTVLARGVINSIRVGTAHTW